MAQLYPPERRQGRRAARSTLHGRETGRDGRCGRAATEPVRPGPPCGGDAGGKNSRPPRHGGRRSRRAGADGGGTARPVARGVPPMNEGGKRAGRAVRRLAEPAARGGGLRPWSAASGRSRSGFTRVTTVVVLQGGGHAGYGEDVTYTAEDHDEHAGRSGAETAGTPCPRSRSCSAAWSSSRGRRRCPPRTITVAGRSRAPPSTWPCAKRA